MEFGRNFIISCRNNYFIKSIYKRNNYNTLNFSTNNIFNKYLVSKHEENLDEIPIMLINTLFVNTEKWNLWRRSNHPILSTPLFADRAVEAATPLGLIKEFFKCDYSNYPVIKGRLRRGEKYYGGNGIILDKDYNPLFLCTVQVNKCIEVNYSSVIQVVQYRIHISNRVFNNPNDSMSKFITKKIIPFYINETPLSYYKASPCLRSNSEDFDKNPLIIIGDIEDFIVTPSMPSVGPSINKELNDTLISNKNLLCP